MKGEDSQPRCPWPVTPLSYLFGFDSVEETQMILAEFREAIARATAIFLDGAAEADISPATGSNQVVSALDELGAVLEALMWEGMKLIS